MNLTINYHYDLTDERKVKVYNYIIQVKHIRNSSKFSTGGGITVISAVSDKSPMPRIYNAICMPEDQFCKRTGIVYCIQRLAWDLISNNSVVNYVTYTNGGKGMVVGIQARTSSFDKPHAEIVYLMDHNLLTVFNSESYKNIEDQLIKV